MRLSRHDRSASEQGIRADRLGYRWARVGLILAALAVLFGGVRLLRNVSAQDQNQQQVQDPLPTPQSATGQAVLGGGKTASDPNAPTPAGAPAQVNPIVTQAADNIAPINRTNNGDAATPAIPSAGLVINATFDSSITNAPNSAAIQAMINQAIAIYQSLYTDSVTASILFRYSTTAPNGSPLGGGTLAQSNFVTYTVSWNTYINALKADAKTANDAIANASLPANPLSTSIKIGSANGRAVGLNTPPAVFADGSVGAGGPYDGIVTINSAQSFRFVRPPGADYDALRTTEHEIDEVLGLGSFLGGSGTNIRPQDLFSWSAPGVRSISPNGTRYFSIDGGITNLVGFNQDSDGDFGDWFSATCPQANPYVQNAFSCTGQVSDVTATSPEGINLDVIGYDLASTPPPPPSGGPDLFISKSAQPNPLTQNVPLTFTIVVGNNGPGAASNVVVTDNLPASLNFVSCSATNGGVCGGTGNNRTVTFSTLAQGATATVTLVATINCPGITGTSLSNTATVTSNSTTDPNPANNTASTTVTLNLSQAKLTLDGGVSTLEFGPVAAAREPNPNPPSRIITLENSGCAPLLVNFAFRRTGAEVASGKVTDTDDQATFQIRAINPDGTETPVTEAQINGGQQRRFRVLFNPLIPAPAGRTSNLFASQVIPDVVNSVLIITPTTGATFNVPLVGRVTTDAKLINPLAPRLSPLVVLVRSGGDEFTVEFSAYDSNLDIYYATYQFLDESNLPVGDAPGFPLDQEIQARGVIKGQSFTVIKNFVGAAGRPNVRRVRVTLYDRQVPPPLPAVATSGLIGTQNGRVVNVSAASFSANALAAGSIVAAFGTRLATATTVATATPLPTRLSGTQVFVTDSRMVERAAPLFFVAPGQINYQLPPGTASGAATVTVAAGDGSLSLGTINVLNVAPALFTANANGQGVPTGVLLRVRANGSQSFEAIMHYDQPQQRYVATPIDLGGANEQVYLVLFGTGWRNRSASGVVTARAATPNSLAPNSVDLPVLYIGAQGGLVGVDQLNLLLPRTLLGRGEVEITLTVEGRAANPVRVMIH